MDIVNDERESALVIAFAILFNAMNREINPFPVPLPKSCEAIQNIFIYAHLN